MYVTAIVLAAGRGLRFSRPASLTVRSRIPPDIKRLAGKIPKLLIEINSKPIIIYSLDTLSRHPSVRDIIVVVNAKNFKSIISKISQYKIGKIIRVVKGGRRRQDSVCRGLKAVDCCSDLVLIHDGVRPFIDKELVSSLISGAKRNGAAITGVPVKATIKSVKASKRQSLKDKFIVEKTLDRE